MLHQFLDTHHAVLVDRCRLKVAQRLAPDVTAPPQENGIPLFIDQLIKTLRVEQTSEPLESRKISGRAGGALALSEIGAAATRHGRDLLHRGYTIDQVVHDYGDLCQAITEVAIEQSVPIEVEEFKTLNRCLDNAIADAVTEFGYQRDAQAADRDIASLNERLGFLAHELRNFIHSATLAFAAIKSGNVGLTGATSAVLDRSLVGMRSLIDRSLADVRVTAGMPARSELISVADLFADVKASMSLEAQARECLFTVSDIDPQLAVNADRDLLLSAIGNLLQNAFKFTEHQTVVALNAYATADRIRIDVEDHCGGLPAGAEVSLFRSFVQRASDRSGVGLGLSNSRRSIEANDGILSVRDVPGTGCVFTIDLPRHSLA